jgi:hypothetical protein
MTLTNMPELNTNTLVLLVLIVAIVLFDFFRRRKSDSKELMDIPRQSNKRRLFIRIFLLVALVATTFFLLNREDLKSLGYFEFDTPIEDVNNALSDLGKEADHQTYFDTVNPLFEKYFNCLECVEAISNINPKGTMNNEYCRYKIRHFTRAIELGTEDLGIYIQDMRYKGFVGDNYGAKERSKQIQAIIESLDEGDLKQYYHVIANYYLYQYSIYNQEYSVKNSFHLMAIQYYEMALNSVSQINPIDIKKKASQIASRMRAYNGSYANLSNGKYYWLYNFTQEDKKELCRFMSKLGSLGGEEIYEVLEDLCTN